VKFTIEIEREVDGRWIADVLEISGALAYGANPTQAVAGVKALALRVIADRIEHGEPTSQDDLTFLKT
jgi:predicted RNase H-like HicB family nuclease